MNHNQSYSRDPFILQSFPASCAIKCQQIILYGYGINISEEELCRIATSNGWYDKNAGVRMCNNGKLLGCFGIEYRHSQKNRIEDIISEKKRNHCVMVCLNHAKLSGIRDEYNQAAHGVLIRSIDDNNVCITNPSSGNVREYHPISTFRMAWKDSDFYMLNTTDKALFEYDPNEKMMIELSDNR